MVFRSAEEFLLAGGQFTEMLIDAFQCAVFLKQLTCADLAYALHSGHIVCGISAYREHVYYLLRSLDAVLLPQAGDVIELIVAALLAGLHLEDMLLQQLAIVFVRRDHIYVETLASAAFGHRAQNIVGLEAGNHQHRYVQRVNYLRKGLQGVYHKLWRFYSVGFVFRVELVTERASGRIEAHRDVCRLFPPDEFQQIFREAEKDGSIHPSGIYHRSAQEGIVHLED